MLIVNIKETIVISGKGIFQTQNICCISPQLDFFPVFLILIMGSVVREIKELGNCVFNLDILAKIIPTTRVRACSLYICSIFPHIFNNSPMLGDTTMTLWCKDVLQQVYENRLLFG